MAGPGRLKPMGGNMNMRIDLGKAVISRDGDRIGDVDSLVVDYGTKEIAQFIVSTGLMGGSDRIVDISMVERVGDDGAVYLNISSAGVDELPPFVEEQFVIAREDQLSEMPHAWAGGTGDMHIYWAGGYGGETIGATTPAYGASGSFWDVAPARAPIVENESNLREDMVVVNEGTDVVDKDGDKIGTVDQVMFDEDGRIAGFVVKAGFLFHHDVRVPADWIETVTGDTVHLSVTADEAEHAGGNG